MDHVDDVVETISERTRIPISLLIVLVGGFTAVGGLIFNMVGDIGAVKAAVKNHEVLDDRRVEVIEKKQEKYNDSLQVIDSRLSRIEGLLESKK